ncbi:MAG TPA: MBL fold metallo-hydrolase [Allosphingosinicella sp.]
MKATAWKAALAAIAATATLAAAAAAQQGTPYDRINAAAASSEITVQPLRGKIVMLQGSGGNIGVLAGPDGMLMVDAGIAVSRAKIEQALRGLGPGKLRYVVTTHWHWDHADGNSWARPAGATVIAHAEAARRLADTIRVVEWEHTFTPIPEAARPNMLLTKAKTIRFNGEDVLIRPYAAGHTDGDLSVYFPKADVLQTGDTWWNGQYPFVDYVGGGGIDGAIEAANRNIAMAKGTTLVIPGHGPVGGRAELIEFRDMLVAVRTKVAALKRSGLSLEQAVEAKPTAGFDDKWGASLIGGDLFTALVYRGV